MELKADVSTFAKLRDFVALLEKMGTGDDAVITSYKRNEVLHLSVTLDVVEISSEPRDVAP
tara:strand:- start:5158 stop:5340 length:183 start_codon:yes stop_codon:yes gene_type:complete